jgi:hypothetical protein
LGSHWSQKAVLLRHEQLGKREEDSPLVETSLEKVVELSSFRMDAVYCGFTSDEEHSICVAVISFFGRSRRGS